MLRKIRKWITVIQKSIIFLAIVEAIIVLVIGVASSNLYHETYGKFWFTILLSLGAIYLITTIIKIAYNYHFPSSIIDELEAKQELEKLAKDIDRKDVVNNYIAETIARLSDYNCNFDKPAEDEDFKEIFRNEISNGLSNLTNTFTLVLNTLLNTSDYQFTSGIYVNSYKTFNSELEPHFEEDIFVLRDDFQLDINGELSKSMTEKKLKGNILEIQSAITSSFNNGILHSTLLTGGSQLILCSNIKSLTKKGGQEGVLFIIMKNTNPLPNDLDTVLPVFTNIISHWLEVYHYKVTDRALDLILEESEDDEEEGN